MKKIFSIGVLSLCAVTLLSSTSIADTTVSPTSAGAAVTIASANGPGDGLTFNPSPGVSMSAITQTADYALSASNVSASVADRNDYGVWSGYGGYYQQESASDATTAIDVTGYDPSATTSPFASDGDQGWIAMGGS